MTSTPEPPDDQTRQFGSPGYDPLSGGGYEPSEPARHPPETSSDPSDYPPPRRHVADPLATPASSRPTATTVPPELAATAEPTDSAEPTAPASSGGALRHLFGALVALVFTPAALALVIYGGHRYFLMAERSELDHDARALIALGIGAFLFLVVASMGALSPVGPLLAGVLYGLAPAGLYLAMPDDVAGWIDDTPVVSSGMETAAIHWLTFGAVLAVGVTLLGTGIAASIRRPRRAGRAADRVRS